MTQTELSRRLRFVSVENHLAMGMIPWAENTRGVNTVIVSCLGVGAQRESHQRQGVVCRHGARANPSSSEVKAYVQRLRLMSCARLQAMKAEAGRVSSSPKIELSLDGPTELGPYVAQVKRTMSVVTQIPTRALGLAAE